MQDFLNNLTRELHLTRAQPDEFFGEWGGQPLILTYLDSSPPAIMFKVRVNTADSKDLPESQEIALSPGEGRIKVSVETGYGWLTIYSIFEYTVEDVVAMLDAFLQVLTDAGLSIGAKCTICRNNTDAEIRYGEGHVNRICETCADLAEQKCLEKEKLLDRRKYMYSPFILIGVITFGLGWALFWLAYDWSFSLAKVDTVQVTDIGLALLSIATGVLIALPSAFLLKKLHIRNHISLSVVTLVSVLAGCVLGEIFYLSALIYKDYHVVDVRAAVQALPYLWKDVSEARVIMTFFILFTAILLIYLVAKTRRPAIEI